MDFNEWWRKNGHYGGSEIEIWLEPTEDGWEPALGGDTVNHLNYVEPRKEPILEPVPHLLQRNIEDNIEIVTLVGVMLIVFLVAILSF